MSEVLDRVRVVQPAPGEASRVPSGEKWALGFEGEIAYPDLAALYLELESVPIRGSAAVTFAASTAHFPHWPREQPEPTGGAFLPEEAAFRHFETTYLGVRTIFSEQFERFPGESRQAQVLSLLGMQSIWGALRERLREHGRTGTFASIRPEPRRRKPQDDRRALQELAGWTGLSHDEFATVLGVSRRSVYNWLRGRPVSEEFRARILRTHTILRPLAEAWDPVYLSRWLREGSPPSAELVSSERWDELQSRVRSVLRPAEALDEEKPVDEAAEPEAHSADAHRAALQFFTASPDVPMRRRASWRPAEVTGVSSSADEDE